MEKDSLGPVPTGTVNLDTVRSLHQTVVSLRTALELSKNELKELKEKYEEHSRCIEFSDVIEKLTLENHILRRKIIDSDPQGQQNIKLEVSYSPRVQHNEENNENEANVHLMSTTENLEVKAKEEKLQGDSYLSSSNEKSYETLDQTLSDSINAEQCSIDDVSSVKARHKKDSKNISNFETKLELLSKFDVKIKVKTLNKGSIVSNSSEDSSTNSSNSKKEQTTEEKYDLNLEQHIEHFDNVTETVNSKSAATENVKMAVPSETDVKSNVDKFGVQVRITSDDSLVVKETVERGTKDTLNLDVDSLSLRSMSEGDNSVFSEGTTPNERHEEKIEQENASGNESEVDDIELIFTADESKDMSNLQEDLVSIQENENWTPSSSTTHSTPVLIKFHTLDPDFQARETPKPKTQGIRDQLRMKRVSLPSDKDIKHVGFNGKGCLDLPCRGILKSHNKSDNMLYRKSPNASSRRLDSVDSLSGDYNRLSLDHTKSSSFELGSSLDVLHRDESVDSFYKGRLGHRFSVFAATDISKCGMSEDDLASNLNIRRNTCPNPFQYRPSSRVGRSAYKGGVGRPRPLLAGAGGPRRDSAAQTDLSALPPKWTSDGNLAYKVPELGLPRGPRRAPPRVPPRPDDTRRVLLSDIGFTSMVPELSRSAEPLWRLQQAQDSPLPRYLSRGYRSPCPSVDRSSDYIPHGGRAWRSSLPDVRADDTDSLLQEAEAYLRRSVDSLRSAELERPEPGLVSGQPYIPAEARQLRLGHAVKVITPQGRLAVGRVRYVGIAGSSATNSSVVVGAEFPLAAHPSLPRNDGTHRGRRYFTPAPHHTALFVPFTKVVLAWTD